MKIKIETNSTATAGTPTGAIDSGLKLRELFELDVTGMTILRQFITPKTVEKMNQSVDAAIGGRYRTEFPFMESDSIFLDQLSHPRIMEICEALLGRWFRFESEYGIQDYPSSDGKSGLSENLHGGNYANQGTFQYHWHFGRPQNGVLVFGLALTDVKEGDGGFVMIPGSHKQQIPIPGREIISKVLEGDLNAWWLKNPALSAGDLIVFTEALVHGTTKWNPPNRARRFLYYRYCPGYMTWRDYSQTQRYARLARNELEKNLFRPAYVASYDDQLTPLWKNEYREPTIPRAFSRSIKFER